MGQTEDLQSAFSVFALVVSIFALSVLWLRTSDSATSQPQGGRAGCRRREGSSAQHLALPPQPNPRWDASNTSSRLSSSSFTPSTAPRSSSINNLSDLLLAGRFSATTAAAVAAAPRLPRSVSSGVAPSTAPQMPRSASSGALLRQASLPHPPPTPPNGARTAAAAAALSSLWSALGSRSSVGPLPSTPSTAAGTPSSAGGSLWSPQEAQQLSNVYRTASQASVEMATLLLQEFNFDPQLLLEEECRHARWR